MKLYTISFKHIIILSLFVLLFKISECRTIPKNSESIDNFHSDVIVTKWPTSKTPLTIDQTHSADEENKPGWMRQQLMKFGNMASRVGNAMGSHATKITAAVDKVCEIVKTIIPLLAAVCHVGQFKFCAATSGSEISDALNPSSLDLNIPD
ncbi:unnamed protein product [Brassicogethes aeneus]|uniref:Uncharacterized protein n=1 Tax=Brassicogethes aeneus TaxID=1431903 RepID=A0A9P0FKW0_BRAAE|nr:unnamed protein product [Brassicogethes aeneus]